MLNALDNKELFHTYLRWYGETECGACDVDYFLRYWATEKRDLYNIFGGKFILEKEIQFNKSRSELVDEIDRLCWSYGSNSYKFLESFRNYFCEFWDRGDMPVREYDAITHLITDGCLADNEYQRETYTIEPKYLKTDKPIVIQKGCKAVKIIGKIAEACGLDMDYYEEFRQKHSQVLNQKKTMGTLCLSIHPLDYVTMSDNECGWCSCMQWMEEAGDYRLGTIEMMNSPYVVVAYLKATNDMYVCGGAHWNNKRWRQLIIVTPEVILGNKQYPYENDVLQGSAMKWLRNLCEKAGFGQYEDEAFTIHNNRINTIKERRIRFDFAMNFMYNDIYDDRMAFLNLDKLPNDQYYLNVSGQAVCVGCGCNIYDDNSPGTSRVSCQSCCGEFYCHCCGEWHCGDPYYINGDTYCHWCYENELGDCECCGEKAVDYRTIPIVVGKPKEGEDYQFFDYNYSVYICDCCYCNNDLMEQNYGGTHRVENRYGYTREVFFIEDMSDEALCAGEDGEWGDMLIKFRDADSIEKRKEIFDNRYDHL